MKKKWLILPVLTIIFIFTLIPIGYLNADSGNLVENGNFKDGLNHWNIAGTVNIIGEAAFIGPGADASIEQAIDSARKNLKFSFDLNPANYAAGGIGAGFDLYKNSVHLGMAYSEYPGLSLNVWHKENFKISTLWKSFNGTNIPSFDEIDVWVYTRDSAEASADNIKLVAPGSAALVAEPAWIRTMTMTCYQVWINSDNKFEMVFWYPYRDNNWVKIYDMSGKEVYSVDMPIEDPHIIVDLPNGMYTVKTFNDDPSTPLQTFIIGK